MSKKKPPKNDSYVHSQLTTYHLNSVFRQHLRYDPRWAPIVY